ncbi:hypothetical protein EF888_21510 [Silicimonas algicola]|uniref:hypothetical protein n=1 Tax=Silicimonas algicola TaxID=1826607 RepID=UPI000F857946|nr:hypothetical protein [Silicimonas algicola]AZQ69499.1 hypothetical protein EF888_21510 [Silicimonas algicola]
MSEFKDHPAEDVLNAFSWAFFDGNYEPTDSKKVWARKLMADQKDSGESEDILLARVWHTCFPKTGGRDPADYFLADWVRMGFEELSVPVTYALSGLEPGQPSTKFGKVVQAAFAYRRVAADWRRPTERAAKPGEIEL